MKKQFQQFFDQVSRYNDVVDEYKRANDVSPGHALAHVNWGIELAQADRLEEALEKFQQAAEIAPNRPEPFLNWGVCLAKLKRLEEALEKFQAAAERDTKAAGALTLWGATLVELGRLDEAKEKYQKAIALFPDNPEPYANFGIALARSGAYPEAIQQFKQALSIHGYQPQIFFLWGAILAEQGDFPGAIEKFKLTLRFMPKHAEAYYFWSVVLNQMGRYEEALEKSKKAIRLEWEKAEAYLNQGDILANLNRLDVAISNYRHATTLDPDLADAYLSWGVALCKQKQYDEGYDKFRKCLSLQTDSVRVHHHWGEYLVEQGRYADALEHLQASVRLEPDNINALLNLAMALLKLHRTEEAIPLLLEIERKDRWNPQAHYLLGTHYMGERNFPKALEHLNKALEERPDFEDASINLALVLCESGDTLEAVRRMRTIIRRLPDSAPINFYYGTMLYRHGDYKDAITKYQKAIAIAPNYREPHLGLAEVYLKQDALAEAEHTLSSLLKRDRQCVPAGFLLGVCAIRQADQATSPEKKHQYNQKALHCFEKVISIEPAHLDSWANRALMLGRMQSVDAMNEAFDALIRDNDDVKGLLLYYWSKALDQLGEKDAALAKLQAACHENPLIAHQMDALSL